MKRKNKEILYSVEVFFDKENFSNWQEEMFGIWGGGSAFCEFKQAFEIYKDMTGKYPKCKYRIISSNGHVRMKSK